MLPAWLWLSGGSAEGHGQWDISLEKEVPEAFARPIDKDCGICLSS
jgi:hypothetical protein